MAHIFNFIIIFEFDKKFDYVNLKLVPMKTKKEKERLIPISVHMPEMLAQGS
jgi:hypothetical protein